MLRKMATGYSQLFGLVWLVLLLLISYGHATGFVCPNGEEVSYTNSFIFYFLHKLICLFFFPTVRTAFERVVEWQRLHFQRNGWKCNRRWAINPYPNQIAIQRRMEESRYHFIGQSAVWIVIVVFHPAVGYEKGCLPLVAASTFSCRLLCIRTYRIEATGFAGLFRPSLRLFHPSSNSYPADQIHLDETSDFNAE